MTFDKKAYSVFLFFYILYIVYRIYTYQPVTHKKKGDDHQEPEEVLHLRGWVRVFFLCFRRRRGEIDRLIIKSLVDHHPWDVFSKK